MTVSLHRYGNFFLSIGHMYEIFEHYIRIGGPISIDRYIAIVYPLEPRMSKLFAHGFPIPIWASLALLSLPSVLQGVLRDLQRVL